MATELTKGQNSALSTTRIRVSAEVALPTDISALLVAANGKVRSDADFVFYNQPNGPGVTLTPAAHGPSAIDLDLSAVPADIAKIRFVASLDGSGQRFGQVAPLVARIHDASGTPLFTYVVTGLTVETIMIAVEVYRRGTEWKVRAVGQGYAGGLAELITDHGVVVDDRPTPPAAGPAGQPLPPPVQQAPVQQATVQQATVQQAPMQQVPSHQPPAYQPPPVQQSPSHQPPNTFQPAPTQQGPTYQPPNTFQQAPVQQAPAYQPPPVQQGPSYQPPNTFQQTPATPPAQERQVGDSGGPVNLVKGQRVSLRKRDGSGLSLVRMGLGWDPIKRRGVFGRREAEIDLDASAIMFADRQPVDVVFYNHLQSKDGSVRHTGDNRTGHGDGDDESIVVDLARIPAHVTTIVFVVTSYTGSTFAQIENAFCRLVDEQTGAELVRYTLSGGSQCTATVMTKVYRDGATWKMAAIGDGAQGKTPLDLIPLVGSYL